MRELSRGCLFPMLHHAIQAEKRHLLASQPRQEGHQNVNWIGLRLVPLPLYLLDDSQNLDRGQAEDRPKFCFISSPIRILQPRWNRSAHSDRVGHEVIMSFRSSLAATVAPSASRPDIQALL